jgi:hypothetical protein
MEVEVDKAGQVEVAIFAIGGGDAEVDKDLDKTNLVSEPTYSLHLQLPCI